MKKKNEWEVRKIKTASISLKKTISIPIEDELDYFVSLIGLGGYTKINMDFILSKLNMTKKEFDEKIWNYILELISIKKGSYSEEFRKYIGEELSKKCEEKEQKERWAKYISSEEYK